jgi:hypothetical protein
MRFFGTILLTMLWWHCSAALSKEMPVDPAVFFPRHAVHTEYIEVEPYVDVEPMTEKEKQTEYKSRLARFKVIIQSSKPSLLLQCARFELFNANQDQNNLHSVRQPMIMETYRGFHCWMKDDLVGSLVSQIGQLIGKWISEVIDGWIADSAQYLCCLLVWVCRMPDWPALVLREIGECILTKNSLVIVVCFSSLLTFCAEFFRQQKSKNRLSKHCEVRCLFGVIAAPTLLAFEFTVFHIFFTGVIEELCMLSSAVSSAVRGGILAGVGGFASAFAPLLGGLGLGVIGGTIGELSAFVGLLVFLVLGLRLLYELGFLVAVKSLHSILLVVECVYAPLDLLSASSSAAGAAVKNYAVIALYTVLSLGLLRVIIRLVFSEINPWCKVICAVVLLFAIRKILLKQVRRTLIGMRLLARSSDRRRPRVVLTRLA